MLTLLAYLFRPVTRRLDAIDRHLGVIMSNQEQLDANVAKLNAAVSEIRVEIDNLKAQPGAEVLDFSGLDDVTAKLTAIGAEDDEPAPAPEPDPAPPVDEDSASVVVP